MKECTGYFNFNKLRQDDLDKIKKLNQSFNYELDYGDNYLEFYFSGKDTQSITVKYFYQLAKIINNADGELVCELTNDNNDTKFEYYTIKQGKLFFQTGEIVRSQKKIIIIDKELKVQKK